MHVGKYCRQVQDKTTTKHLLFACIFVNRTAAVEVVVAAEVVVEEVGVTTAVVEAAEGEAVESGAPVGAAGVMAAVAKVTTAAGAVMEAALAAVVRGVMAAVEGPNLNSRGAAALRLTRAVAGEDMALGTSQVGTSSGVNSKAAGATRAGVSNRTRDTG